MAITTWTSEGMAWDSLTGKLLYPYAEALRLALAERYAAAGVTLPAALSASLAAGYIPTAAWGTAYDSAMSVIFGHYADPASLPTAWTEAALLSAIGAGARFAAGVGYPFRAAWAAQQYALLNRLTHARHERDGSQRLNREGWGVDWASAVAALASASWSASDPVHVAEAWGVLASQDELTGQPDQFAIVRSKVGWHAGLAAGVVYSLYARTHSPAAAGGSVTYECPDYAAGDGDYLEVVAGATMDGTGYTPYVPDYSDPPTTAPANPADVVGYGFDDAPTFIVRHDAASADPFDFIA